MPNSFKFADWITMESLRHLKNKLIVAEKFNTEYNKEFTKAYAVGETVRVKLPQRFIATTGLAYQPQAIDRRNTTVTVDQIFGVHFDWDSAEKALKMERGDAAIREEYIVPAMNEIAQQIDSKAALWAYQHTNNVVGALATNPTAISTYHSARQKFVENACPAGEKAMILTPGFMNSIASNLTTLQNPTDQISKLYKEGFQNRAAGFDWYESMSLYEHTAGTWAGAVTVNGAGQTGSSLNINCTSGDTFKKGDKISIANVLNANPSTRRSVGSAKHFTILADVTATAATATLTISPAIEGPGSQYQNVDALAANTAALTLWPGTGSPNGKVGYVGLGLHKDAFALVGVPMEKPTAAEISSQMRDPQTGISVRFVRMFDPRTSQMLNRFDVLLGFGDLYPDNCAVAVAGDA